MWGFEEAQKARTHAERIGIGERSFILAYFVSAGSIARAGAFVSMVIQRVGVGWENVLGLLWPAMMAERGG